LQTSDHAEVLITTTWPCANVLLPSIHMANHVNRQNTLQLAHSQPRV